MWHVRDVLKAPQVTAHLAEFAQVFPEARFVAPERDPYRVVSSGRAMATASSKRFSLRPTLQSTLDFSSSMLVMPYADLVADPAATTVGIYEQLALPADPSIAAKVDAHLDAQR